MQFEQSQWERAAWTSNRYFQNLFLTLKSLFRFLLMTTLFPYIEKFVSFLFDEKFFFSPTLNKFVSFLFDEKFFFFLH